MMCGMAANPIKRLQSLVQSGAFCAAVLASPVLALADNAPPKDVVDWRLEGYGGSVTLDGSSTSVTWLLLVGLGIICIGVFFKNERRTHLD